MDAPSDCDLCPRLAESRKMVVNGAGPYGDVMVIAQNPGKNEELVGEPLIGWSGQRLAYLASLAGLVDLPVTSDKAEKEIALSVALRAIRRENIVRCRPPRATGGDDTPTPTEVKNCRGFLLSELANHPPKVIVTLGLPAWKWFHADSPLNVSHGLPHQWTHPLTGTPMTVIPMYHPALAHPARKPKMHEVMMMDWRYLGSILRGEGDSAKPGFLAERLLWNPEAPMKEKL